MTSSQSHQADVGPHKHVRLLSRTSSFYPQQRCNRYICWATVSCCCLGSLIAIAIIVVAVAGVIIPLRDDIDAQVCKVRLCSTQAEGACPATSSPVGETLNATLSASSMTRTKLAWRTRLAAGSASKGCAATSHRTTGTW